VQAAVDEDVGDHAALLDERRDIEASIALRDQNDVFTGRQRGEPRLDGMVEPS
jgi:hypothetical protein